MSAFSSFIVLPSYGPAAAAVEWALATGTPNGDIYFYRSDSGIDGSWTLLNRDDPMTGRSGTFVDWTAGHPPLLQDTCYRAMVDPGGGSAYWVKGDIGKPVDSYTAKELTTSKAILRRELDSMRRSNGNGVKAFHYIPLSSGDPASRTDVKTGQVLGPPCPADADTGYGTPYAGGFHPPVHTWVRKLALQPLEAVYRQDGTGSDEKADVMFRMLAHPRPLSGHLVVLPGSREFYVLDDPVGRHYLRGIIPLLWECPAKLLDHADPRRQLALPTWDSD